MIALFTALLVTVAVTGALLPVLRHRVVDVPNHRSSHKAPTPRGGGLGVMAGVCVSMVTLGLLDVATAWPVLLPAIGLAAVGFWDDLRSLPGAVRLALQVVAAAWLIGAVAYEAPQARALIMLAIVATGCVGYVNAFNFMDGINGISAANAVVSGAWFAFLGHQAANDALLGLGLALTGAALGFVPWNAPRARIFLGDVGSYGLGMLIAGAAALAWASGESAYLCLAPSVVYLADTAWVLVKRAYGGRPLMQPHREHVYQRLVDTGWTHVQVALLTAGLAALVCLLMFIAADSAIVGVVGAVSVLAAYLALPRMYVGLVGRAS